MHAKNETKLFFRTREIKKKFFFLLHVRQFIAKKLKTKRCKRKKNRNKRENGRKKMLNKFCQPKMIYPLVLVPTNTSYKLLLLSIMRKSHDTIWLNEAMYAIAVSAANKCTRTRHTALKCLERNSYFLYCAL